MIFSNLEYTIYKVLSSTSSLEYEMKEYKQSQNLSNINRGNSYTGLFSINM